MRIPSRNSLSFLGPLGSQRHMAAAASSPLGSRVASMNPWLPASRMRRIAPIVARNLTTPWRWGSSKSLTTGPKSQCTNHSGSFVFVPARPRANTGTSWPNSPFGSSSTLPSESAAWTTLGVEAHLTLTMSSSPPTTLRMIRARPDGSCILGGGRAVRRQSDVRWPAAIFVAAIVRMCVGTQAVSAHVVRMHIAHVIPRDAHIMRVCMLQSELSACHRQDPDASGSSTDVHAADPFVLCQTSRAPYYEPSFT